MRWFANDGTRRGAVPDDVLPVQSHVLGDRACCCPARPVVTVIMPPAPGRPHPVDLLLCRHHFQVSRASLADAGAAAYDNTGALILGGASAPQPAPAGARSNGLATLPRHAC